MNIPFRWKRGQGLELSADDKTQSGYLRLQNASVDQSDVIRKRAGAVGVPRTTTSNPDAEIPVADLRALWYRQEELGLETNSQLYARRKCAGAGAVEVGTATQQEIDDTQALLAYRAQAEYLSTVPLAGGALTADALTGLDRQTVAFAPIVYVTLGAINVTAQLVLSAGVLKLVWSGPSVTPGEFVFPANASNPRHFQSPTQPQFGRCWAAHTALSGSTTPATVYTIEARDVLGAGTLLVQEQYTLPNVLGGVGGSCLDGTYGHCVALTRGAQTLVNVNNTDTRAYAPALPTASAYTFAGSLLVTIGLRVLVAPVRSAGESDVTLSRYSTVPGTPSLTDEVVISTPVRAGGRLSAAYTSVDDTVGIRSPLLSSDYTIARAGVSVFAFDSVDGADLELRAKLAPATVTLDYAIDGVVLAAVIAPLAAPGADASELLLVRKDDGQALLLVLAEGTLSVVTYADVAAVYSTGTSQLAPAAVAASSFAGGAAATVVAYAYTTSTDQVLVYAFDVAAPASIATPLPASLTNGTDAVSVVDAGGGDVQLRAAVLYTDPADSLYRTLWTYAIATATSTDVVFARLDPCLVGESYAALLQSGPYPRCLFGVTAATTGQTEVYEIDAELFVRVLPATVGLSGGNWAERGPWTRGTLRVTVTQDWGAQDVRLATGAEIDSPATGGRCLFQLVDIVVGALAGVQLVIFSDYAESGGTATPVTVDPDGLAPHVVHCTDQLLAYTFVSTAGALLYQFWAPGASIAPTATGITAESPTAPVYDLSASASASAEYYGAIVKVTATDYRVQVRDSATAVLADFTDTVTDIDQLAAVAIYAYPEPTALFPTFAYVAVGTQAEGPALAEVRVFYVDGGVLYHWTRAFAVGVSGEVVRAVTIGGDRTAGPFSTALVSVEIQEQTTFHWEVRTFAVEEASDQLIRTDVRCAIYGAYVERAGQLFHVQSAIEAAPLPLRRNGLYAVAPRTGEIVARADCGAVEDLVTRASRSQVVDTNRYGTDALYLSWAFSTGAVLGALTATKSLRWDGARAPNRPAVQQGVAISAHGGYPRAYDSSAVFEQDWHELPRFLSTVQIAGSLAAGQYGLAITWDWYDGFSNLYRSAPYFATLALTSTAAIEVTAYPLQRTERQGVQAVVWRTLVNGSTYYRAASVPATDGGLLTLELLDTDAVLLASPVLEILDQVPGTLQPSEIATCTDFVASADDRLWSRSPERAELAPFSTVAVEGRAPHWPRVQALQSPTQRGITGIHEIDGRVVMFTVSDAAYTATGGPDDAGQGSYQRPSAIPSSTGSPSFPSQTVTPDGVVYGTTTTPYILTRGMQTMEYSDQVSAPYELDGERAEVCVWRPDLRAVVLSNGPQGRLFRFHRSSQRWGEDVGRASLDLAVSDAQEVASLLADGRVLVEGPELGALYADGDIAYQALVSTPWIHARSSDLRTHGAFTLVAVRIWGEYEGPHDLQLRIYTNYATTPFAQLLISSARLTSNQAAGLGYLFAATVGAGPIYAARIEVSDAAETNATWRLAGIDAQIDQSASNPSTVLRLQEFE